MNALIVAPLAHIPRRRSHAGFSLVELMVVVAIIGILMAVGIPGLRTLMDNQKMKSATFDIVTTVMQARSEAIKFGTTTGAAISIAASSGSSTGAARFTNGWCIVFSNTSACSITAPGGDVMGINAATANVTYTVKTCTTPNVGSCVITFGRNGRLSSGLSVKIEVANDVAGSPLTRCVTIDSGGNAHTKVGVCT